MDESRRDYLIELDRVVERQVRVYSDLLDRVATLVREDGLDELADKILFLKRTYGLGDYKHKLEPIKIIKQPLEIEKAKELTLAFLELNKGVKFLPIEILSEINGQVSDRSWWNGLRQLIKEHKIKVDGWGKTRKYWME